MHPCVLTLKDLRQKNLKQFKASLGANLPKRLQNDPRRIIRRGGNNAMFIVCGITTEP